MTLVKNIFLHLAKGIIFSTAFLLLHFDGTAQSFKSIAITLRDSIIIKCNLIEAGSFVMGSPDKDTLAGRLEKPQRMLDIKKSFYLGVTEVTIEEFQVFIDETHYQTVAEADGVGGHGFNQKKNTFEGLSPQYNWKHSGWIQTAHHPVVNISWIDATRFCEWLSIKSSKMVRLPSEEEWEYACRAGTSTVYFTGDDPLSLIGYANISDDALREKLDINVPLHPDRTFSFTDGYPFTAPVGSFKPNPWGLYDMTGNVYEVCNGIYSRTEVNREYNNVVRGGSYNSSPEFARCAFRGSVKAASKYGYTGFRIAVSR